MAAPPPPLPSNLPPPPSLLPNNGLPPPPPSSSSLSLTTSSTSSITTLSKLNPTTVLLTNIPPFLRHPRNLRDLLNSTTIIKHVFYSCPIKRYANDNNEVDDANENVVAVVKFSHSGNALSISRIWKHVQNRLNEAAATTTNNSNNNQIASICNMNAFLLYSDTALSLHPEKSQVDANIIETIWDLTHKQRDSNTDAGKVAQQADENMIQILVDAYRMIEKRQKELDIAAAADGNDHNYSNSDDVDGNIGDNDDAEIDNTLKLDSAKLRAAAGGGAYDEETDPLNAPEVLEAVKEFKKRLEITQGGFRKKRKEYVEKRLKEMVKTAKERLIQQRKEMEEMNQLQQQQQQLLPPPPLPSAGLPPPPVPPEGLVPPPQPVNNEKNSNRDTGRRGVSNLPAWMTANNNNGAIEGEKKRTVEAVADDNNDDGPLKKKKFIPSDANRDINARKERIVVDGTGEMSLAAIRAANEAADKEKEYLNEAKTYSNDQILSAMFPKLDQPEMVPTIRKFVKEQMMEYLGEEEATLIDFVMNYLVKYNSNGGDTSKGNTVNGLLHEMRMVLEEDTEIFAIDLFKKILDVSNP